MDRTITLTENDRLIAKDGTVIQMIRMLGDAYRMVEVLRWAALNGFVATKGNQRESTKRSWNLIGHGAYEGWKIACINRSDAKHVPEGVDVFQDRHYTVFYGPFQVCNYFPPQGATYEEHLHTIIDRMLDGSLLDAIQGRGRDANRLRDSSMRTPTILLKRAA